MTRTEILARAFDFRRAWSVGQGHGTTSTFGSCDSLLLSILLDLDRSPTLAVSEEGLRVALAQTLESLGRAGPSDLPEAGERKAPLRVLRFSRIEQAECDDALHLVYDLPRSLPLTLWRGLAERRLIPFAFVSSATWSSRLALLTSLDDEAAAFNLIERLAELLNLQELDPLSLYDELQRQRATTPITGDGATDSIERCRALERRLRGLEVSGLVRHQTLLVDADRRRRLLP